MRLRRRAGEIIVNLEEIWERGAVVEAEEALDSGESVQVRAGTAHFSGHITSVERHEFGWRCAVEFSPLTPWSEEAYRPEHLFDPEKLKDPEES